MGCCDDLEVVSDIFYLSKDTVMAFRFFSFFFLKERLFWLIKPK